MDIATDNTAILWYTAWPHLHPNSSFHDAFEEILKVAKVLRTEGKMPQNTEQVVKKAFSDVGVANLKLFK
ncbi:TPA: hypothetical protein QCQ09_004554 [Bacillus cereus]|nr:hypothetical protein [Bacillus cereus]